jgi:hypothetical protein
MGRYAPSGKMVSTPIKNEGRNLGERMDDCPRVARVEFLKIGAFMDHHRVTMSRGKHKHCPEIPISYVGCAIIEKSSWTH